MAMDRVDPKAAAARGATFALAAWRLIMRAVVIILFLLCFGLWLVLGRGRMFWILDSVLVEVPLLSFFLHAAFRGVPFWKFYFSVESGE